MYVLELNYRTQFSANSHRASLGLRCSRQASAKFRPSPTLRLVSGEPPPKHQIETVADSSARVRGKGQAILSQQPTAIHCRNIFEPAYPYPNTHVHMYMCIPDRTPTSQSPHTPTNILKFVYAHARMHLHVYPVCSPRQRSGRSEEPVCPPGNPMVEHRVLTMTDSSCPTRVSD